VERHSDIELKSLKEKILAMGGQVERAIEEAVNGLVDREPKHFDEVQRIEKTVNQSHIEVDEACVRLLARQAPVATDLRLVIAVIKINTDLERMGDQAVNISHNGRHYLEGPPIKPLVDLPKMAEEVRLMVRQALDAFVRVDVKMAQEVLERDDVVDQFKHKIFHDLISHMESDPKTIHRAINLVLIARNLERLGDHATNIAEDVIFASTGKDIRHGPRKTPSSGTSR
jgi:phosphate transport system protein